MKTYRKRPVEVQAVKFVRKTGSEIVEWLKAEGCSAVYYLSATDEPVLEIKTLEGTMRATEGDYVIRGVQGEFYPCKPDIFKQTYEEV